MSQRSLGLTWLDRNDHKQQKWAHKYLQKKGETDQKYDHSTIDQLLRIGEELESTREGILIIEQMKNAWRKVKSNASDKDKDRKIYAFKLKVDVKKELTWLAKKNKVTAADMLGKLISGELDAHVRFETRLNEEKKTHKELLRNSRNNTAQYRETNRTLRELLDVSIARLCRAEILLEDAALSTRSITEDQQRRIEELREQTMTEAHADITGKIRLLRSGLLDHPIKGINTTRHAAKEAAANTTGSTPKNQRSLTSKKPATRQQTQDAKPEPSPALRIDDIKPLTNHSPSENLDAKSNENTSPLPMIGGTSPNTQPSTQSPQSRYRIYASVGKGGIMSSFTKQRPTKTDSTMTPANPTANEKQEAQPNEITSRHFETDRPPLSIQTTTQSPCDRDEYPQTLGDILRKEEEEARRLKAETRPA